MKVKELISRLKMLDQEKVVYLSSDEEGNNFGTLDDNCLEVDKNKVTIYPSNQIPA